MYFETEGVLKKLTNSTIRSFVGNTTVIPYELLLICMNDKSFPRIWELNNFTENSI